MTSGRDVELRRRTCKDHALDALGSSMELELELIQSHMAQKPVLRGDMGERGCARRLGGWVWV